MFHGKPNWFELDTARGALAGASAFYGHVFGWSVSDAGMPGFTYLLASHGEDMVAGLMEPPETCPDMPPAWMIYLDVDDCDAAAGKCRLLGGKIWKEPADVPGTGRFAVLADPQGAVFGILQPAPMDPQPPVDAGAWNQRKDGHGNWIELMSTDPMAGLDFYAELFGWTKGRAMDMGPMGQYQLFAWEGTEIGGTMGLGDAPLPCWLAYFGVNGVDAAMARITGAGGSIVSGPHEVPGPAFIAVARDPQGAHFAIVGPKETA